MKKIIKVLSALIVSMAIPFPIFAESEKITSDNFSDILVSFLYLAAVLALIYVILLLVDRWGRKNARKNSKDSENGSQSEISSDNDSENDSNKGIKKENTDGDKEDE